MKIAINRCYGVFDLSEKAVLRLIELGYPSEKAPKYNNQYYLKEEDSNEFRCNPLLIQVIEELGEEANTEVSKLKVVDTPFETPYGWHIESYDGMEKIRPEYVSYF
jgi:hypothetical protein